MGHLSKIFGHGPLCAILHTEGVSLERSAVIIIHLQQAFSEGYRSTEYFTFFFSAASRAALSCLYIGE